MHVAIVHDDLVQWGGAERVLKGLCEIYPDAPIFTSLFDYSNNQLRERFGKKDIRTSFLQNIPGWKFLYKALLPLYPIAFEQFDFSEFDLVISQTTRFAKAILTKPTTKHICYCHTPPRFLWHFSGVRNFGIEELLMSWLRIFDRISSARVDYFLAGSKNARRRIAKIYGQDSKVVYPFIDLERFENVKIKDGNYFVVIGRPNKYKRFDLAKKACSKLGLKLKVISGGLEDKEVVQVLAGCKALIIPGVEDFGLTSLEAQALGKPVIAFREGGALESVIEGPPSHKASARQGKTGLFFDEPTVDSLIDAINRFNGLDHWSKKVIQAQAQKFSRPNFIRNFKQAVASL